MESVVSVRHEMTDGFHVFTSPQMPGFYLVGPDDDFPGLCDTIPTAIASLAEANLKKKFSVRPVDTFSAYREATVDRQRTLMHFVLVDA